MASLFEVMDPSNLRYATGQAGAFYDPLNVDQGAGPPSGHFGWIRTGNVSIGQSYVDVVPNCVNWTTGANDNDGTVAILDSNWIADPSTIAGRWKASATACDSPFPVWCVQDQ